MQTPNFVPASSRLTASFLALLAAAVPTDPLASQATFGDLRPKDGLTPLDSVARYTPVLGDLNGDGIADMVTFAGTQAPSTWWLYVYEGLGEGRFTRRAVVGSFSSLLTDALAMADFDGDGDRDLYAADGQVVRLYRNLGGFTFVDATSSTILNGAVSLTQLLPADLDGDGDTDLVARGGFNIPNALWLNDGTGRLTDATPTRMPPGILPASKAKFVDIDADGDLDLLLSTPSLGARLYLNDGSARFTDVSASRLPSTPPVFRAMDAADVDRDGDPDVVIAGAVSGSTSPLVVLRNDGTGNFSNTSAGLPTVINCKALSLSDLDNDGAPELLLQSYDTQSVTQLQVLGNNGTGQFADISALALQTRPLTWFNGMLAADVDGDGWNDLMAYGPWYDSLFLNDRQGRLRDVWLRKGSVRGLNAFMLHLFDADRDGDLDLIGAQVIFRNDGRGRFEPSAPPLNRPTGTPRSAATGDVDGDGDVDIAIAPSSLWLNNGAGTFANADQQLATAGIGTAVAMGDLDNDGDLDLAVTGSNGLVLWANDGAGRFLTTFSATPRTGSGRALALADVDRDGDLDVILGWVSSATFVVYINQGSGQFVDESATRMPTGADFGTGTGISVTDLDGDGDLDLLYARLDPRPPVALMNDGSGRFTLAAASYIPFVNEYVNNVATCDYDGDGDMDIVTNRWGLGVTVLRLYVNQGSTFVYDALALPAQLANLSMTVGDVDNDGDVDIITDDVVTNTRRQIEVFRHAYSGGQLEITHYATDPRRLGDHTSLALMSAGTLPVPLATPWGNLVVDPALALVLPSIQLQAPSRRAMQPFPVPVNPGLFGSVIHLQAIAFANSDPTGSLHLTNAISETLR